MTRLNFSKIKKIQLIRYYYNSKINNISKNKLYIYIIFNMYTHMSKNIQVLT